METTLTKSERIPKIGLRILKSSLAIGICYLIALLRHESGIVFYSFLSALWCIQPYTKNTKLMAKQRTIGTAVGAIYGLVVILIQKNVLVYTGIYQKSLYELLVTLMIIVVIYTTVLLKKKNASYFSCVVFLSIVVIHIGDANPVLFVWNRFLDTMIGIIVGMAISSFDLPRERHPEILFVSGLDDTLLRKDDNMSDYSKVDLNRMLDDGAKITLSTMRTPASIIDVMKDIRLNLPVIAMDGAVLYDIKEHTYLKVYTLPRPIVDELLELIHGMDIQCFVNGLIDNVLLIYYEESEDEIYNKQIRDLDRSPYRNYVKRDSVSADAIIYLMILEKKERIAALYRRLEEAHYTETLKVLMYDSYDYPGYAYIKIYNKNASKTNMMAYLTHNLEIEKIVTFGSIEGKYDVMIHPGDSNHVVKEIKRQYEPLKKIKI